MDPTESSVPTAAPQGDEDPIAKGLIQDDLLHPNEDSQQQLAETLAEAGFGTSEPPN